MDINYKIIRSSKRKTLTISIERDCKILVYAPMLTSDESIAKIVDEKRQWIHEKLKSSQKYKVVHPPGKELVNGESLLYLGVEYPIQKNFMDKDKIFFENAFILSSELANKEEAAMLMKSWYIKTEKEVLTEKVFDKAKKMGVLVNTVKISDNKYRWGSCSTRNTVSLN